MKNRLIELLQDIDNYPEKTCPKYGTGEECGDCQYKLETEKGCDLYARKADYMIAKGLMYPPCKVGQTVYVEPKTWRNAYSFISYDHIFISKQYYIVADVVAIIKTRKQTLVKLGTYNRATFTREYERYPISAIGKTVFLTKEEAEQALKGGNIQ